MVRPFDLDAFFDLDFYRREANRKFASRREAVEHFLAEGQRQGLNPSPFFMWSWVRDQIGEDGLDQYFERPAGVPPHPLFLYDDCRALLAKANWMKRFAAWIASSPLESLVPDLFLDDRADCSDVRDFFAEVTGAATSDPLETEYFSSKWYNFVYADVADSGLNPLHHYLSAGWKEGRDPSPQFSTSGYLAENRDVRDSGVNPLLHFANFGWNEDRRAPPTRDFQLAVRYQTLNGAAPAAYAPFDQEAFLAPEALAFAETKRLVIVVPFYKREDLVETLFGSLLACAADLRKIGVVILCVNDSPDHAPLDEAICRWFAFVEAENLDLIYVINPENKGFIHSSNMGVRVAEQLDAHCLLLNSDTIVTAGAIVEMLAVLESDEKFGFVNPRSNNATIATYGAVAARPEDAFQRFRETHSLLPRWQVTPVAVGFCLLVRAEVIRLFGYLDPVYGLGYHEENDLIMRANRRGYGSVLANRAFVAHIGAASFSLTADASGAAGGRNERIFHARYPEFRPAVRRYFESSPFNAQRLIERRNDFDVVLDLRSAAKIHNGTTKLIRELVPLIRAELSDLRVGVASAPDVEQFLGLNAPEADRIDDASSGPVKSGLNLLFSQPFSYEVVDVMVHSAERIGFFLLDSIAVDCLYTQPEGLLDLWRFVCSSGDLFLFNSDYTMARFRNRFSFADDAVLATSEHSIDPADYADDARRPLRQPAKSRPRILIFGNHYEHKGVLPAVEALSGAGLELTVFGMDLRRGDLVSCAAGQASAQDLSDLWSKCDVLVFPSLYEGFGFPVLESVARKKPLVLLDSELNRHLHERLGRPETFFFFRRFSELPEVVGEAAAFNRPWPSFDHLRNDGWKRSAREIAGAIRKSLASPVDYTRLEKRLFLHAALSKRRF